MDDEAGAEPVRLVIWDLDETFWTGTLSEGPITYRREIHDIVLELARRGIVSSICSKNDEAPVRAVLEREGIWESFVFPSINWQPKGPRLAALVEAVQLRAPTIMFIDDNPMNRAEARHFVPGLQVVSEQFIPRMLASPLFRGKDDAALSRLAQYKMLERRREAEVAAGADTSAFLRASHIRVAIEHDLAPHIDRAIELINRTNQLNFTKARLPEDIDAARLHLRKLLAEFNVQAGILRVRDDYGDYGYCGLYIVRSSAAGGRLLQFCFSCRILGMAVETWLYRHLGRPQLTVEDEVLADVMGDDRAIDWINPELPELSATTGEQLQALDYLYARGGCDLQVLTHYFGLLAREVHREFNVLRQNANYRLDHSMFAHYALAGISDAARAAFATVGYIDDDFTSVVGGLPRAAKAAWILSFWADAGNALYRHRGTGCYIPLSFPHARSGMRNLLLGAAEGVPAATMATLRENFEYCGMIERAQFTENVTRLLRAAPPDTTIFVLLANDRDEIGGKVAAQTAARARRLNDWTRALAARFANVHLVEVGAFVENEGEMVTRNHFDRLVYFRLFKHIAGRLGKVTGKQAVL